MAAKKQSVAIWYTERNQVFDKEKRYNSKRNSVKGVFNNNFNTVLTLCNLHSENSLNILVNIEYQNTINLQISFSNNLPLLFAKIQNKRPPSPHPIFWTSNETTKDI